MTDPLTLADFALHLRDFIPRTTAGASAASSTDAEFNELARRLFELQFEHVPVYRRFCEARQITPASVFLWPEIPALPVSVFKELEVSSLSAVERTTVFHSSGTTAHKPSRHFHNAASLEVYEASAFSWFSKHVLGDTEDLVQPGLGGTDRIGLIILTPPPAQARHSSLVHMFETVRRELGAPDSVFTGSLDLQKSDAHWAHEAGRDAFHRVRNFRSREWDAVERVPTGFMGRLEDTGAWVLDIDATLMALRKAASANRPVVLLGTAFSFVHLLDHLVAHSIRCRLAEGSCLMETGGYKGRSREMSKAELHEALAKHLGVPDTHIVSEYGMSELSSQAYDRRILDFRFQISDFAVESWELGVRSSSRIFRFPPWARVQIVSPETGQPVSEGETGLIRVFDLANVRSVMAIQTEDLGVRRGDGFELIGRADLAEPRGCSLMAL